MPVYLLSETLNFPHPSMAEPEGLLAVGGDLSLDRLLTDVDLRADLAQRGQKRAAAYTWESTAAATVARASAGMSSGTWAFFNTSIKIS